MGGVDLLDLFVGRMSWRRFAVVLERLPPESQYKTELRDSSDIDWADLPAPDPTVHGPWSHEGMLLARLIDEVAALRWMQSDGKTPPPDPYSRPGVKPGRKVTPISPAAAAYLEYLRTHQGAAPPPDWTPDAEEVTPHG